ncbi:CRISPR-associated helicase Cas3' [Virgibacillus oceani]
MIIAKTKPEVETLWEHTNELLERYKVLKEAYFDHLPDGKAWKLLYISALYHDLGKVNNHFQNRMSKLLKLDNRSEPSEFGHIPHNYLSPFFVPIDSLNLSKNERKVLIQAIAFHHERNVQPEKPLLTNIYHKELLNHFPKIKEEMNIKLELPDTNQSVTRITKAMERRIKEVQGKEEDYYLYILVKGLLHRLDHAASAHVPIEIDSDIKIAEITNNYMANKFGPNSLRELQNFTYQNQDKNLIIVAQTGMGKTEASLLWAGSSKTFFTLPIRVSLNALYDRVYEEMGYSQVGLLHCSSAAHLDKKGDENWEVIFDQSKHLSNKLLFTTIDQILKFPFKFKGYEKFFATMAYSKVIIDEIQAYDPWITAVILRAIEMIHKIGGRFMIMTATMPQIYLDELYKRNIIDENCIQEEFVDESFIRHKLGMRPKEINDDIDSIKEAAENNKVLVIVNTVKKAVELYQEMQGDNVYLLHSRFILKDRLLLEKEIKSFAESDKNGIWITTQLVEASIDIDFDILFTELSSIDSLLQRFGRCYRKRELSHNNPNIYIYTDNISGNGFVYDKDILLLTLKYLRDFHEKKVNEREKIELVKKIYSTNELQGTQFYEKFKNAVHKLNYLEDYEYTNEEAQKMLRGMQTITVIPRPVYDDIYDLLVELEKTSDSKMRTNMRRKVEEYTVSVQKTMIKGKHHPLDFYQKGKDGRRYNVMPYVEVLDADYEFDETSLSGSGLIIQNDNPGFL